MRRTEPVGISTARPAALRLGWWTLGTGIPGLVVAYLGALLAPSAWWPAVLLALSTAAATVGLTLVAIGRHARRALVMGLVLVHALLAIGLMMALPSPMAMTGAIAGVPRSTIVVLVTAGIIPLLLLPLLYALTFAEHLTASTLARVRRERGPS